MKNRSRLIIWLITFAVFIFLIYYSFFPIKATQYWDGLVGNLFATMIGAILGILIALDFDRSQQQKEASERKEKILNLLGGELIHSATVLESSRLLHDDRPSQRVVFLDDSVKDELWRAFSDGGELEWIKDLDLLDNIAYAYHYINIIRQFEKRYLDVEYSINYTDYKEQQKENIAKSLLSIQENASRQIDKAIDNIKQHLGD